MFGGGEGDKKVSDLISADTKILEDGTVQGTLYNVTGFTRFSSDVTKQSGHFFPFTLNTTGSKMTFMRNGTESKKDIPFDKDIIFRVDDCRNWEVLVDGSSVIKLDLTKATLN